MQMIPSMQIKSPEAIITEEGVTVPRATRCNRRVAPGRLSLAAPSGRGHLDPAAGVSARRAPSRAGTCAHRRTRRPRTRVSVPSVPEVVRAADPPPSAAPLVLRGPRHRRRRGPLVLHPRRVDASYCCAIAARIWPPVEKPREKSLVQ